MPIEQPNRTSRSKKVKCYASYCVLGFVACLSIVIIPVVYVVYALKNDPKSYSHSYFATESGGNVRIPSLPWYTSKGLKYPTVKGDRRRVDIWPDQDKSDRIVDQLMYLPTVDASLVKTIVMYHQHIQKIRLEVGQDSFFGCPVESCSISFEMDDIKTADAILFSDREPVDPALRVGRPSRQVWVLFLTKNPLSDTKLDPLSDSINWTASYRTDSDIVTPYVKWVYYNETIKALPQVNRNFAHEKTKQVVWFVRDPSKDYNERKEYVKELQKHIDVDVFGHSEGHPCPCETVDHCLKLSSRYKFFIAFENSDCRDYITKKFFVSLQIGVVPLVMGPPSEDYLKTAPLNSYIHVDKFSSPKKLAEYLHELDKNDDLYNAYFRWRGAGEMIDTRVGCRLCALLHSDRNKAYSDVNLWWRKSSCKKP